MPGEEVKTWKSYVPILMMAISIAYYMTYFFVVGGWLTFDVVRFYAIESYATNAAEDNVKFALLYFGVGLVVVTFILPFVLLFGVPLWLLVYNKLNRGWTINTKAARGATLALVGLASAAVCIGLAVTYLPILGQPTAFLFSFAMLFLAGTAISQTFLNRAMRHV